MIEPAVYSCMDSYVCAKGMCDNVILISCIIQRVILCYIVHEILMKSITLPFNSLNTMHTCQYTLSSLLRLNNGNNQ